MSVMDSKRETLLADIELTRQQLRCPMHTVAGGFATFRGAVRRRGRISLPLLASGIALVWLYRSLRLSRSRGGR